MLAGYFSPLAPAAVLLLGAFILAVIIPRLPVRWPYDQAVQTYGGPVLVGVATVALLGTRLTFGEDPEGQGLEMLSGWNLSTAESAAALTVRADGLSLAFLVLTLLILLPVSLAALPMAWSDRTGADGGTPAGWLLLSAAAAFLVVAANGLTIGYAVLLFDTVTAIYWLRRRQPDLAVARLFLGILTASGLMLVTIDGVPGALLWGAALWLRLGLLPFIEVTVQKAWPNRDRLVYLSMSLAVGLYLVSRSPADPLPQFVHWLVALTMLLNGLLTWLVEERPAILSRLVLTFVLPILLIGTTIEGIVMAYAIGLTLSLGALWVTPRLGKPHLTERAWLWPYFPPAGASLTLIGLPFFLGWPAWTAIYEEVLRIDTIAIATIVLLAEGLALSGLVRYWQWQWSGSERDGWRSAATMVMMVPFLLPGLAPLVLAAITRIEVPASDLKQSAGVWIALGLAGIGALGLGYFRAGLVQRLNLSPSLLAELIDLRWLLVWAGIGLDRLGRAILRLRVFLEGRHYMGWALLSALLGVLIILLGSDA